MAKTVKRKAATKPAATKKKVAAKPKVKKDDTYTKLVAKSSYKPEELTALLGTAEPCPTGTLEDKYGLPRKRAELGDDCKDVTSDFWKARIITANIGPFKARGYWGALDVFKRAFAKLKTDKPEVYRRLGSAGMLCVRRVRGSKSSPSNHCFGMALDITIDGELDTRGDNKIQQGLIDVWSVLKDFGLYWGLGFRTEDAMHFEISKATVDGWIKDKSLDDAKGAETWVAAQKAAAVAAEMAAQSDLYPGARLA
jgi:hypothetical protein